MRAPKVRPRVLGGHGAMVQARVLPTTTDSSAPAEPVPVRFPEAAVVDWTLLRTNGRGAENRANAATPRGRCKTCLCASVGHRGPRFGAHTGWSCPMHLLSLQHHLLYIAHESITLFHILGRCPAAGFGPNRPGGQRKNEAAAVSGRPVEGSGLDILVAK